MSEYDLQSLRLPKLTGLGLTLFTSTLENPTLSPLILGNLLKNGGIIKLRQTVIDEQPTLLPLVALEPEPEPVEQQPVDAGSHPANFPFKTVADFAEAYTSGKTTPLEVAEKVIFSIVSSDQAQPPLRAFIALYRDDVMAQAQASTERYKAGKPLSPLDGVPVAIKDELSLKPYPTTFGTSYIGPEPVKEDSTVVARLRAAGALLLGKANMHDIVRCGRFETYLWPAQWLRRDAPGMEHRALWPDRCQRGGCGAGLPDHGWGRPHGWEYPIPASRAGGWVE
jgi:hypothetical protein